MLGCLDELVHKDIDQGLLKTCANVSLVLFHELGIFSHLIAHEIKQRGLDSAETVVETRDVRL